MKNIWTIARRDFRSYFTSPLAYFIISAFLLLMGWIFFWSLDNFSKRNLNAQQYGMSAQQVSIAEGIIRPFFGNINVILIFLIPFITMRLLAEEKRQGTIQLLFTSPVKVSEIIFGKFLSAMGFVSILLICTVVHPLFLFFVGEPDVGHLVTCYLGTLLLTSCYVALGLICSALTENQILAGILTFAAGLFFWLINWAAMSTGPFWAELFEYLSLIGHFENFTTGVISSADVVFYLSFVGFGLFLSHRILDSYRWR